MKKLKTKIISALAPFVPTYFKIETLYNGAVNYYSKKQNEKNDGLSILFDLPPAKKAQKDIESIIAHKKVNEFFIKFIELDSAA